MPYKFVNNFNAFESMLYIIIIYVRFELNSPEGPISHPPPVSAGVFSEEEQKG